MKAVHLLCELSRIVRAQAVFRTVLRASSPDSRVYIQSLQQGLVITVKPWLGSMVSWGWEDQTDSDRLNVIDRWLGDGKSRKRQKKEALFHIYVKTLTFLVFFQSEYWKDEKDDFHREKNSWKQGSKWREADCNYSGFCFLLTSQSELPWQLYFLLAVLCGKEPVISCHGIRCQHSTTHKNAVKRSIASNVATKKVQTCQITRSTLIFGDVSAITMMNHMA